MSDSARQTAAPTSLQERFILGVAKRLPELESLIDSLGGQRQNLELTIRAFRNLSGIGGMYGFPEVALLAQGAAERCAILQASASEPQTGDVEYFRAIAVRVVEICSIAKWGTTVLGAAGPMRAPLLDRAA